MKGKGKGKGKNKSNPEVAAYNDTNTDNNTGEDDEELGKIINDVNILSQYQADKDEEVQTKKTNSNTLLVKYR